MSTVIDLSNPGITSGTGWLYNPSTQTYTITDDVTIEGTRTVSSILKFNIAVGKTAIWTATVTGGGFNNRIVEITGSGRLK